ncbi:MAG: endonuclease III domain-containing protein [Deltaproteobacteria bacterium]
MKQGDIDGFIELLRSESANWNAPVVTLMAESSGDPFRTLISTILSLRTLDATTEAASRRLFALADTPLAMLALSASEIERSIYPVGFYKTKAKTVLYLCRELVEKYDSKVPDDLDELLKLKGVGRKTANLVVGLGYGKPSICVDTHVHRISNRLGYVSAKNPAQTEVALRQRLPTKYWIEYNSLLVAFGQSLCRPISPWCSLCAVKMYCDRVGVEKSR